MNDNLILILAILISSIIGAYLGMLVTKLKSKSEKSTLEERNTNLQQQLNDFKQFSESENQKQNHNFDVKLTELRDVISKIEAEREAIRREKDFLNTELTRRNSEYENLQQLNIKRDEELEERQKQLRTDFENLANKILDAKSEKFTLQNKENIKNILNPLQEKIKTRSDLENQYTKQWYKTFKWRIRAGHTIAYLFRQNWLAPILLSGLRWFPFLLSKIIKMTHGKPIIIK